MYKVNQLIKRLFDIVSSMLAIILLIPLWIGVSVAIKKDSKGPILFRQRRRTKDGREFQMYKFRSMMMGAEKMEAGLFNYKDDPRVTRVGRKLRDTSVDELPQLFNILKGEMSVVGPRPPVIYELGDFDTLNQRYKKRFQVKAGMTGMAQVKGRNNLIWDEKVNYDNQYIDLFDKYGVIVDFVILIETIFNVLHKENIYENKTDELLDNAEAASLEEEEIIRLAHLPEQRL